MAFALHCALCFSKLCFVRAEEQKEQFPRLAASSANLADYNSAVKAIIEVIEKEPRIYVFLHHVQVLMDTTKQLHVTHVIL